MRGPQHNIGDKFGRWTLVEKGIPFKSKANTHQATWYCVCECGTERLVRQSTLRQGNSSSCGCGRTKSLMNKGGPPGDYTLHLLHKNCSASAIRRGIDFNISREQFVEIAKNSCFYCGEKPKAHNAYLKADMKTPTLAAIKSKTTQTTIENSTIYVSGLDRIDNAIGYTVSNSVACCFYCNAMKSSKTKEVFLTHIEQIYKFQQSKKEVV